MSGSSILLALALAAPARALPPYQRLFQAKYRYRPSCALCHERDSDELNGYGRSFFKSERSAAGFAGIESGDQDGDGVPSGAEIRDRSNPGDPRSKPGRPGGWLDRVPPAPAPERPLRAFFPDADTIVVREREPAAGRRREAERRLGRPLREEEALPVYFEALRGGVSLGAAVYGSARAERPCAFLAGFARAPGGGLRVAGLRLVSCARSGLKSGSFLDRFKGRSAENLGAIPAPRPEAAREAAAFAESLRAAAVVLEAVYP